MIQSSYYLLEIKSKDIW